MSSFRPRRPFAPTRGRIGLVLVLVILALGWRLWPSPPHHGRERMVAAPGTLSGHPRVSDGDSLAFGPVRIRLSGIDAPETDQTCLISDHRRRCGDEARDHLSALIAGRPVTCNWSRLDKYGRQLAHCRAGDTDLNAGMVQDGWAVAYGAYDREEADARDHMRGIWSGRFVMPEDFRRDGHDIAPPWWKSWLFGADR